MHDHYVLFFNGHIFSSWTWELGPIKEIAPWFHVLRFAPGPKTELWSYVTMGASLLGNTDKSHIEFLLLTDHENPRAIELLAMVSHYHHKQQLGVFHSLPIGQPWLEDATCDHFLVSYPYPFGEELEICNISDFHVHTFWLLPITKSEYEYKKAYGVDALEQMFDDAAIEYWDLKRRPVV